MKTDQNYVSYEQNVGSSILLSNLGEWHLVVHVNIKYDGEVIFLVHMIMMVEPFEVQAKTTKSGHLPLHKCGESKENKYFLQISNIIIVLLMYFKFIMQEMILKAQHFCAVHSMYILCTT